MGFHFQNPPVAFHNVTEHDYIIVIVSHLLDIYLHTDSRLVLLTYILYSKLLLFSVIQVCNDMGTTTVLVFWSHVIASYEG